MTVAAGRRAAEQGCSHVLLNATGIGQPVYARAGATVEFAEAIGIGDLDTATAALRAEGRDLDEPLLCGKSPLGIAAAVGAAGSARWLLARGAPLDVVAAWSLGWRDEAAGALARDPTLANRRTGPWRLAPLHVAAQRGDAELARLVLAADPDRTPCSGRACTATPASRG